MRIHGLNLYKLMMYHNSLEVGSLNVIFKQKVTI